MSAVAPAQVLIPIPNRDFDPTEVAIPGLDPWGFIPGLKRLKLIGLALRADARARRAYAQMQRSDAFQRPLKYAAVNLQAIDGLLLPGGHRAAGMRAYLESPLLQGLVARAFDQACPGLERRFRRRAEGLAAALASVQRPVSRSPRPIEAMRSEPNRLASRRFDGARRSKWPAGPLGRSETAKSVLYSGPLLW